MTDMRQFIKDKCALAITYADDGAYTRAAQLLREAADATKVHAQRVAALEDTQAAPHKLVTEVWKRDGGSTWRHENGCLLIDHSFQTNKWYIMYRLHGAGGWAVWRGKRNRRPIYYSTTEAAMKAAEHINH